MHIDKIVYAHNDFDMQKEKKNHKKGKNKKKDCLSPIFYFLYRYRKLLPYFPFPFRPRLPISLSSPKKKSISFLSPPLFFIEVLTVIRLHGSTISILLIRSFASLDTLGGKGI